ncbi:Ax21 family sulfation-dependent quorum factor [Xanthomonas sacchari]|nr:Ax21 family sulfation-dependent quorum factor [Xanthomonas sacchari]
MKTSLLALGLLATLPFAASAAEGLSYNYVEGGYVKTDASGGDADGWAVKGSYAFHPNFSVFGDFNRQKTDFGDVRVDQWRIGAGYNHEIATSTDLVTRVAYNRFDPEYGTKFNGWSAEAGIRTAFNPYLEVYALGRLRRLREEGRHQSGRPVLRPPGRPGQAEPELGPQRRPEDGPPRRQGMVRRPALQLVSVP